MRVIHALARVYVEKVMDKARMEEVDRATLGNLKRAQSLIAGKDLHSHSKRGSEKFGGG